MTMNDEAKSRLHAIVQGKVQGVSFRYFVEEHARSIGVFGWVRNMWNGQVEVTAEGVQQDLEKLLEALRQGPPMARVSGVVVEWQTYTGEFSDFRIRSTSK
jgi:acylphosphatase